MSLLKTVALIDDDPVYTQTFKNLLGSWQIPNSFRFFNSSQEALKFIQLKEASHLPDILLLDLNMPVMDGWRFIENFIHIAPDLPKKISIYLVSSSIWEEDIKRAQKNKLIKEFIIKPISKEKLQEILS